MLQGCSESISSMYRFISSARLSKTDRNPWRTEPQSWRSIHCWGSVDRAQIVLRRRGVRDICQSVLRRRGCRGLRVRACPAAASRPPPCPYHAYSAAWMGGKTVSTAEGQKGMLGRGIRKGRPINLHIRSQCINSSSGESMNWLNTITSLAASKYIFCSWKKISLLTLQIINRPVVARAVLQSPLLLIHSYSRWSFHSESSRHCLSQTIRAVELKFWENVHPPPCVTCHVSHVTCHVSCVTQSVGASRWRVCYQRGLPRLV